MLGSALRVKFEELRSLDNGDFDSTYVLVGSTFDQPVRMLKVNNTSDVDLIISYNGVDDHDFVPSQAGYIYDYGSNKIDPAGIFEQPKGEGVWVRTERS